MNYYFIFFLLFNGCMYNVYFSQYSGWDEENKCVVEHPGPQIKTISGIAVLDNHTVNLISSFLTAMLTPIVATYFF